MFDFLKRVNIEVQFPELSRNEHPNRSDNISYTEFDTTKSVYQLKKQIVQDLNKFDLNHSDIKLSGYPGEFNTFIDRYPFEPMTEDTSLYEYLLENGHEDGDFLKIDVELAVVEYVTIIANNGEFDDSPHISLCMDKTCPFEDLFKMTVRKLTGFYPRLAKWAKADGTFEIVMPLKTPSDMNMREEAIIYLYQNA